MDHLCTLLSTKSLFRVFQHCNYNHDVDTVLGEDATLLRMSMLSLFENEDSGFLVHAALLGEEDAMRDYLQKYPNEVTHG